MEKYNSHQPQLQPSTERRIGEIIYDRVPRTHSPEFAYSILQWLREHPGFDNSTRQIAAGVGCGKTSVERIIKEFLEKGLGSTLAMTAKYHGFQLSKSKKGAWWRVAVDHHMVPPIFLDPAAARMNLTMRFAYGEISEASYLKAMQMFENPLEMLR